MPTYDYKCNACGNTFEEFQSMTAPHLKKCPKCGKNKLERLIGTGAAVMFKGSGFYITDYGKDGKKDQRAASKPSDSASSSGKSEGKSSGGSEGSGGSSSSGSSSSSGGSSGSSGSSSSSPAPAKPSSGE